MRRSPSAPADPVDATTGSSTSSTSRWRRTAASGARSSTRPTASTSWSWDISSPSSSYAEPNGAAGRGRGMWFTSPRQLLVLVACAAVLLPGVANAEQDDVDARAPLIGHVVDRRGVPLPGICLLATAVRGD